MKFAGDTGIRLTSWCVIADGHALLVKGMADRSVPTHPLFTGVSRAHLSSLIAELARPWVAEVESRRHQARGGARKPALGAGARHQLVFVDRLVATLIHLRHDLPHAALALLYEVDRSDPVEGMEASADTGQTGGRGKALTQPRKLRPGATPPFLEHNEHQRHEHSSQRITVEHALADHKRWKQLTRWTHRRNRLPDTYKAIATLVSDRSITT